MNNNPFDVVAEVSLKEVFKAWRNDQPNELCEEPLEKWRLKLAWVFEDETAVLCFENWNGKEPPYYRVLFYEFREGYYQPGNRVSFTEKGLEVTAVGMTKAHDAFFFRCYDKEAEDVTVYILRLTDDCADYEVMDYTQKADAQLKTSTVHFVLVENKRAKFVRVSSPYSLNVPVDDMFDHSMKR